jgi:predicted esterase
MPLVQAGCAPSRARCAVILVHGRGRETGEMLEVADRLALDDVAYLAPAASGSSWYPQGFMAPLAENQPWLDHAFARVDALVASLGAEGFSKERVVLLGFSQGACLVLEYAARTGGRYGAVVAFTGGLIGPPGTIWTGGAGLEGTPVFLGTSDVDEWVPVSRVEETAEALKALGADVELRVYPGMEHVICDDEIEAARRILRDVGNGRSERSEAHRGL